MEKLGVGTQIQHPSFGYGVIVEVIDDNYTIYFLELEEAKEINNAYEGLAIKEKVAPEITPIEISDIEEAVENILARQSDSIPEVELANKWLNGSVTINAGSDDLQGKEIPLQTFFHKIIMVRERLRVLEQNINNQDKLDETDKLHLQQYITKAYGSLTTFNVLFANKEDQFKGAGR